MGGPAGPEWAAGVVSRSAIRDHARMEYAAFIKAFLALFAMMNPIGNTGIFISMTGDLPLAFKVKAAIKVTITVLIILIGAAFGGTAVLNAFGISLPAFQLAGGLIVLGIGFKMLHGGDNPAHKTEAGDSQIATVNGEEERVNSTLIVPLSMPILGGPGSIATVITVAAAYPTLGGTIGVAAGTAALTLIMGACFAMSGFIGRFLTAGAQQIILRFMGLILVAIASDMMLTGFQQSLASSTKTFIPEAVEEVEAAISGRSNAAPTSEVAPAASSTPTKK